MGTTKPQNWQLINDAALKTLGKAARSTDDGIMDAIAQELDAPLKLRATFPVADSKLNLEPSIIPAADGGNKSMAPIKSQVYTLPASTVDFQTQVTTGATFVLAWPSTNTVGYFRRVGFTLIGNGTIQALFSEENVALVGLVNPGTLFVKSGVALGFLDIECTDNTTIGKYKSAGSATAIIENAKIYRFSSGSGGGSGTGNVNDFETYMALRLQESFFQFATNVIFEVSEQTMVNSATASYNLVDATYDFSAIGQNLITKQLFSKTFLTLIDEAKQIELHAEWFDLASVDTAATFEASLNGGLAWQTIAMGRNYTGTRFSGRLNLDNPASAVLFSQATNNSTKELNTTTQVGLGQKITLTGKNGIRQIQISLTKTGTPTGSYTVKISKDNAGSPGDVLYSSIALCESLSAGANAITLSGFKSILPAGDYWLSIDTDATYKASFATGTTVLSVGGNNAIAGYRYNGTIWSVLAASGMFYSLSGHTYDLRVRVVSGGTGKKLKAFGIFFDEQVGSIVEGLFQQQEFIFSGDDNQTVFNVTRFLPDSRRIKIYDVYTGQTYVYPSFNIDGKTITFPPGTFQIPGKMIQLRFDQSEGVGFDYSDINSSLLTANHLGSKDSSIDKSLAGRGIILRCDVTGEQVELWVDQFKNLQMTAVKE